MLAETLDDLKAWLDNLDDQTTGAPCAICEVGEPYEEFFACAIARPDDEKALDRCVSWQMRRQLEKYFDGRNGRIYWRIPFGISVYPHAEIVRFDEGGDDVEPLTLRKCVLDKNWVRIDAYCRLYRARHKTVPELKWP